MKARLQQSALVCAGIMAALPAAADPYGYGEPQRAGRWETALEVRYQSYETMHFTSDITLDPGDSWGAGFSLGYNFDQNLNLSFEVVGDTADYRGTVDTGTNTTGVIDGSLDNSSGQLNLTYNWFDTAFTPFMSGGIGWNSIDSHIIKSYAGSECWYHPWYGYVCNDYYNTYKDTMFSYNVAVGARWDISDNFFVRGSVGKQWLHMSAASSDPAIEFAKMELGFML